MPDPNITLTTDFGTNSAYVAALKGAILSVNPAARLVDLSHQVPPQDVRHTAYFLEAAVPYFPPGTIHVVVVDPGVGSGRALLCIETAGQRLLAPDNGCWTFLPEPSAVYRLANARYWRHQVSDTFHGRDILGPAAGHVSLGVAPAQLGPRLADWVRIHEPQPRRSPDGWIGEVVYIDHFGNLITNLKGDVLAENANRVCVAGCEVAARGRTYSDVEPGCALTLISSGGHVEIAVNLGNAAQRLGAKVGAVVRIFV